MQEERTSATYISEFVGAEGEDGSHTMHRILSVRFGEGFKAVGGREAGRFGCVATQGLTASLYRIASTASSQVLADWFAEEKGKLPYKSNVCGGLEGASEPLETIG